MLQIWERNKRTLLFVTHSVEEAVLLGTTVAVMTKAAEGGKLIREIAIDMPRPRDTTGAEFNDYKRQILTALQMDVAL